VERKTPKLYPIYFNTLFRSCVTKFSIRFGFETKENFQVSSIEHTDSTIQRHIMAVNASTYAEWMWQSSLHPFSSDAEDEWRSYSEEQNDIIEEAYQDGKSGVYLQNYYIDFKRLVQVAINSPTKQRPIKRLVHNKGNKKLEEELYVSLDHSVERHR
jgi:hypothetical protein